MEYFEVNEPEMSTEEIPNTGIGSKTGTAIRQRGKSRVDDILKSGQSILISEGYANLTLRRIADQLGISNGNVTYYFPNKDALLRALIEDLLKTYDQEFAQEAQCFPDDPEGRFIAYINYLIEDCKQADLQGFFYQLWSLATHNEVARELREQVYEHFFSQVVALLKPLNPKLQDSVLNCNALTLMTLIEGLHVVFGFSEKFLQRFEHFEDAIRRQAQLIVANSE